MIAVALIDDHVVVRSGFAQLLNLEPSIRVDGQYGSAKEAYRALARNTTLDVVVIDISLPDESGISLLERLLKVNPSLKAIILSIYDSASFVSRALEVGAVGYLSKRCGPGELVTAIRTVAAGDHYLCTDALVNLSQAYTRPEVLATLTKREKQVFDHLLLGSDVKEIANKLCLSHKTVHVHRANILSQLGLSNQVGLIRFAIKHKLLSYDEHA